MKHRIVALAVAVLMLAVLCTACGKTEMPTDDAYHFQTDSQYMFAGGDICCRDVAASGKGYYFLSQGMLYYCDRENMEPAAVCAKPECSHTGSNCAANFQDMLGSVYWQDGYVYVKGIANGNTGLYRVKEDGTDRMMLFSLENGETCGNSNLVIHRGAFYCLASAMKPSGETAYRLLTGPLDRLTEEPEELCAFTGDNTVQDLRAYGNYLYLTRVNENGRTVVMVLDLRAAAEGFCEAEIGGNEAYGYGFLDGSLLVSDERWSAESGSRILAMQPDGSGAQTLLEYTAPGEVFASDGEYLYIVQRMYDAQLADDAGEFNPVITVLNKDGSVADTVTVPYNILRWSLGQYYAVASADGRVFIQNYYGSAVLWFDTAEIGSGTVEVHPLIGDPERPA